MKKYNQIPIIVIGLVILNLISSSFYKRFDLTSDTRYTLSEVTNTILDKIDEPVIVRVYLEGDFPSEFKRLQTETRQHLEELKAINDNIRFKFVDPLDQAEELIAKGLQPSRLSTQEAGNVSETIIFPWATLEYKNKIENVSLLATQTTTTQEQQLQGSIENLEYAFADALHKVSSEKKQTIAILKGNGELDDIYVASFLRKLNQYYRLAPFTLDSVSRDPQKTLKQLTNYDLAIIAKPTEKFTEIEKFTLDQYITNGGKSLWLIDNIVAEMDSLMQTGQTLAYNRDLNLTDLLFSYGVRLNYNLIKDLYSSTIRLAAGNVGNQTQFQDFLWYYYPVVSTQNDHSITTNIEPVNLKFTSSIDTLKNSIKKTILLKSSKLSASIGTPSLIALEEVSTKPVPSDYNNGSQILGVLLEGEFKSAYADRIKPFETELYRENSEVNKMILISDGDIIANQVHQGQPLELGLDKWTNQLYGNKTFLLNTVNYLLDDSGLIELRSKTIDLQFLDKQKVIGNRLYWQVVNVLLPLIILGLFGFIFTFLRKRKYS
jgi:gliding-associated putative ABC transporter substrate-binding component GldG